MAVIQPTINQQSAEIAKNKAIAKALRESERYDLPPDASVQVGPYRHVVKMHPLTALVNGLRSGYSAYLESDAAKQSADLEDRKLQAVKDSFQNNQFDYAKAAESGAFDPQTLAKLLSDRDMKQQQLEQQKQMLDYKNQEPTTGQRDALWATGGNEAAARQLLQNKIQNPLGMLNYQLQAGNMAADNARAEEAARLQRQEFDFKQKQAEMAANRAEESAKQSRLQNVPAQHRMAYAENQNALNKIDSAIALIQQNPGSLGAKNYLGDAISQRMDEEGVPVRAAVSEIGGVKLHDLSGAAVSPTESKRLLPLIPQATDAPDAAIKKLKSLRKEYEGINSQLESMYDSEDYRNPIVSTIPKSEGNVNIDIKPETWQAMTPSQRKQAIFEMTKQTEPSTTQKSNVIRYDANGNRVQ